MANTIEINGTGGIIQGDLGTANVNVNLDSSLYFDGNVNDDRMVVTDDNTKATGDFGTAAFSVSFWVYMPSTGFTESDTWGSILGKGYTTSAPSGGWGFVRTSTNNSIYFQTGTDAGGGFSTSFGMSDTLPLGAWTHICITRSGTSLIFYVNGQEDNTATATETSNLTNSGDFKIGTNNTNAQSANITVSDVKIFSDVLLQSEVQFLASKVQADPDVGGLDNCESWWKINEGTSTNVVNHKKGSANGTITGAEWQYNKFDLDVFCGYDGSTEGSRTQTDGDVTVTSGILEGKAMTSLAFDGTNDNVNCASPTSLDNVMDGGGTFAAWIRADSDGEGNDGRILDKGKVIWNVEAESGSKMKLRLYQYFSGNDGSWSTTDRHIHNNKWHHVAVTYDNDSASNDPIIYIDGVSRPVTEAATPTGSRDTDASENLYIGNQGALAKTFDGDIKEVKVFGVILSADQIASLYSNIYHPTPDHYWKLDDSIQGVDTLTAVDSGFKNAANGGLDSFVNDAGTAGGGGGSGWQNGTINLDGKLSISEFGTVSAPRGSLDIHDDFSISHDTSTFTHNNGTVTITSNVELLPFDPDSNENARHIFYDVAHTSGTLYIERHTIIENKYTKSGGTTRQYTTTTFGTDTHAGEMIINNGSWDFYGYYGSPTLQAANQLKPIEVKGSGYSTNGPIDWDVINNEARSPDTFNYIKWIDFQKDMVTGGDGGDAVMLGDCKFAAFTLSGGDELDLGGQRAEFTGNFRVESSGQLKSTGGGQIVAAADVKILGSAEGVHDGTVNMIVSGGTHDWRNGAADGAAPWCNHVLVNGNVTHEDQLGASSGSSNYNVESVIVGHGKLTQSGGHAYLKDLTIASYDTVTDTGGSMEMTQGTQKNVDLYGDLTLSGGLLGPSCLNLDRDNTEYARGVSHADLDLFNGRNAMTAEMWFKTSYTGSNHQHMMNLKDNDGNPQVMQMYIDYSTGKINARIFTSGTTSSLISAGDVRDGKWHHAAIVYDGGTGKHSLYIDGKLESQETGSGGIYAATNAEFNIGVRYSLDQGYFHGLIDEVRLFAAAKSETQIRQDMFIAEGTNLTNFNSQANGSTDGLVGRFGCNDGYGATLTCSNTSLNLTIKDYAGGNATVTDAWAPAGKYIPSTSSIVMAKSGTQTLAYTHQDNDFHNFIINNGSTTQILSVGQSGNNALQDINENLTVHGILKSHSDTTAARIRLRDPAQKLFVPQALEFNGSDQYINIGNELDYEDNITVSGWMRRHDGVPTEIVMFHNGGGEVDASLIQTRGTSGIRAVHNYQGTYYLIDHTSGSPIQPFVWNHVAIVFDKDGATNADKFKLYINGSSVGSVATGSASRDTNSARIGTYAYNLEKYWNGELADIKVYDKSLTASQISTLASQIDPNNARTENLVGHWKLNETSGTTATDSGSGSNNGTHVNTPTHVGNKTTALADLGKLQFDGNGTFNIPEMSAKVITMSSSNTIVTAHGDLTISSELETSNGTRFNGNGNTINTFIIDAHAGSDFDIRNSTVKATASGGRTFQFSTSNLITGDSIIQGYDSTKPVLLYVQADGDHELVGDLIDCAVQTTGDITVIGSVIRCTLADSTANIRQFFHTLDTQQLLDADSGGDDDVKLSKPALDNSNELQTG